MFRSGRDKSQLQAVIIKELSKENVLLTHQNPKQVLIRTNSNNQPPEETTHLGQKLVTNQTVFNAKLSRE